MVLFAKNLDFLHQTQCYGWKKFFFPPLIRGYPHFINQETHIKEGHHFLCEKRGNQSIKKQITNTKESPHFLCEEKGKVVHGSMPGRVIAGQHSSPLSLHYLEREVCAARLPASRGALLSNTRAAQPSGQTSLVTPGLEWAGHPHAADGPYPAPHVHTFLPPLGSQVAATPPR